MILEVTLVKVPSSTIRVGEFLERKHYNIENDVDALNAMIKFLGENIDILNAALPNKEFVTKITQLKNMNYDLLMSIKYALAQFGLDLWFWIVPETQASSETPEGTLEYNVKTTTAALGECLFPVQKMLQKADTLKLSEVYGKIRESSQLFSQDEFSGLFNEKFDPLRDLVVAAKDVEGPIGAVSSALVTQITELLEF